MGAGMGVACAAPMCVVTVDVHDRPRLPGRTIVNQMGETKRENPTSWAMLESRVRSSVRLDFMILKNIDINQMKAGLCRRTLLLPHSG